MAMVLISYLERKKVFKVPNNIENDIAYLKSEVLEGFDFGTNVNLDVTFQKYDEEWEDFVDVARDFKVANKDRLKAVVTPCLIDMSQPASPTPSTSGSTLEVHKARQSRFLVSHQPPACDKSMPPRLSLLLLNVDTPLNFLIM